MSQKIGTIKIKVLTVQLTDVLNTFSLMALYNTQKDTSSHYS